MSQSRVSRGDVPPEISDDVDDPAVVKGDRGRDVAVARQLESTGSDDDRVSSATAIGLAATFIAAVSALAVGLVARVLIPRPTAVLVATGVAVAGAALGNVLLPVAVKRWFADRLGWATAMYSMALVVGSAAAAAATVPIARLAGGWRAGLGAWVVPVLVALIAWLLVAGRPTDATAAGRRSVGRRRGRVPPDRCAARVDDRACRRRRSVGDNRAACRTSYVIAYAHVSTRSARAARR